MTGSTGTAYAQIVEVEALLHSFNPKPSNDNRPPLRRRLIRQPAIVACLAVLVFAPGCAAAAVFLLRNDAAIQAPVMPDSNPPLVIKSDRLPLEQRTTAATETLPLKHDVQLASAIVVDDPDSLASMTFRGSVEDIAMIVLDAPVVAETTIMEETAGAPRKPRAKRHVRRAPPIRVAEAAPLPEPPEPTFLEKLFGTRVH